MEWRAEPLVPDAGRTAIFRVQFPSDCSGGKTVALVDDAGNLLLLKASAADDPGNLNATGIVIANGVPLTLENMYITDSYSTYQ